MSAILKHDGATVAKIFEDNIYGMENKACAKIQQSLQIISKIKMQRISYADYASVS